MNKREFMKILELSLSLKGFNDDEKREILYDYEEHFRIGEESNKTDEELIAELGDPENIAEQYSKEKNDEKSGRNTGSEFRRDEENYKSSSNDNNSHNGFIGSDYRGNDGNMNSDTVIAAFDFGRFSGSIVMVIALLFFNLIFVVGPYFGIVGALIGFFGASIGIAVGGIGLLVGAAFVPVLPSFISLPPISPFALFFFGIGMIALGILFFIGSCFLGKALYKLTVRYIRWNIRVIRN